MKKERTSSKIEDDQTTDEKDRRLQLWRERNLSL